MRDAAEALLLEDDPEQNAEIQALLAEQGLNVIARRDVKGALAQLDPQYHNPIVAVVDWDMSKAGAPQRNSVKVLEMLRDKHPGCTPIAYSANLNTPIVRASIRNANVRSILVDKAAGQGSRADDHRGLLETLGAIFSQAHFGDIEFHDGHVRQTTDPTNQFFHRVGAMILLNKTVPRSSPKPLNLYEKPTLTKAVHRMNDWLIRSGSPVRVRALKNWQYDLVIESAT